MSEPQTLIVGEGPETRQIAVRAEAPAGRACLGLFWLSGFMSDMASTKASAIAEWAAREGLASTRFDYSGHGVSGGDFRDGTIGRWLEEALEVFMRASKGPQIVIGSSMGGYIALLLLRKLQQEAAIDAARIRALVLIAPAWDMTEELMWKRFPDGARRDLEQKGVYLRPSAYGEPYPITRDLIEEGRGHLLGGVAFDPGCPVVIMQGLLDPDVPASHTRRLVGLLTGGHARLIEVADGEHRLSRPQDLETLFAAIRSVM